MYASYRYPISAICLDVPVHHMCWQRAVLRRPVPYEVGAHTHDTELRPRAQLHNEPDLGASHGLLLPAHLPPEELDQSHSIMESVQDPRRR